MRLSLSIACSTQIGSRLPRPNLENWWFQMETIEEMPQVRLYCGLDTVNQCSLSSFRGTFWYSSIIYSSILGYGWVSCDSSCFSIAISLYI